MKLFLILFLGFISSQAFSVTSEALSLIEHELKKRDRENIELQEIGYKMPSLQEAENQCPGYYDKTVQISADKVTLVLENGNQEQEARFIVRAYSRGLWYSIMTSSCEEAISRSFDSLELFDASISFSKYEEEGLKSINSEINQEAREEISAIWEDLIKEK